MPPPSRFRQALPPVAPSVVEVSLSSDGFDKISVVVEGNVIQTGQQWQTIVDHFRVALRDADAFATPLSDATRHELMSLVVDGRSGFAVTSFAQGRTYSFDRAAAVEAFGVTADGGVGLAGAADSPPAAPNRVAFAYDARMLLHEAADCRIAEAPVRVQRAYEALQRHPRIAPYLDSFRVAARVAAAEEILLVHNNEHYRAFLQEGAALDQHTPLKSDVYVCQDTRQAVQIACGCAVDLTHWVWSCGNPLGMGTVVPRPSGSMACDGATQPAGPTFGFGLIRPPGHHCDATTPSGFCIANNVVVAVRSLQTVVAGAGRPLPRISILDLDVHHGEGTQALVEEDPTIQLISIHRYDAGRFYPFGDAGAASHVGPHGNVVNVPFDTAATDPSECFAVMSDYSMERAWERVVLPALAGHNPELVLVSLGFDAAYGDPLGRMGVEHGFASTLGNLASFVKASTAPCRGVVCLLEGGYHPAVVAERCCECMESLLFHGCPPGEQGRFAPVVPKTWQDVRAKQARRAKEASAVAVEKQDDRGCIHESGGVVEHRDDHLDETVLLPKHLAWIDQTLDGVLRARQDAISTMGSRR